MSVSITVLGSFVTQMSVYLDRQPLLGETIVANDFDMGPGGKGNNAAIAIKRLETEVVLIEKLGNDVFSDMAYNIYEQENIKTKYIYQTDDVKTGVGLVYIQPDGENTAAFFKGANEYLSAEDVMKAKKDLLTSNLLLTNLEVPEKAIESAVELAHKNDITIVLNPAPARNISDNIMEKVDVFTPNVIEAAFYADEDLQEDISVNRAEYLAKKIQSKGPNNVIITLGKKGALMVNNDNILYQEGFQVNNIDTVGAGDSFNGALCVCIAQGCTWKESLKRACINGALTTTKNGVIGALPFVKDVNNFIKQYKR